MGRQEKKGEEKGMFIDDQGVFRLFHYDFRLQGHWILPFSAEVPGGAGVYGSMSHCNLVLEITLIYPVSGHMWLENV